jgi:type II secretory pathway component PulF
VAVFQYSVTLREREDMTETGTVVASSEEEARQKLAQLKIRNPRLKKLTGFKGLLKQFSADVR